jgi:hypothetical protein
MLAAVVRGCVEEVHGIIEDGGDASKAEGMWGTTPLVRAKVIHCHISSGDAAPRYLFFLLASLTLTHSFDVFDTLSTQTHREGGKEGERERKEEGRKERETNSSPCSGGARGSTSVPQTIGLPPRRLTKCPARHLDGGECPDGKD